MARILLKNLRKMYDDTEAVRGIDLEIPHNEFLALVGPSGCGKSTTLRMIAGLESITSGEVIIGDRVVNTDQPKDRDIAMVFQNYALYPHMTVYQNMSFGLRLKRVAKAQIHARVLEAAEILNITELLQRRPKQLSGGQRQRVAMGRSIVRNPQAFLFDEPLSNLDAKLRVQMRTQIKKLHQKMKTTVIYVTHDQVEAMTLADRIVVMNGGRIEQVDTPQNMYDHPTTKFVAGFIGSPAMNMIACTLERRSGALVARLGNGLDLEVPTDRTEKYTDYTEKPMIFGIRPEHITEKRAHVNAAQRDFSEIVRVLEPMGVDTMVFLEINGEEVSARAAPHSVNRVGEAMEFTIDLSKMHLIDPTSDRVI
ncbi:sugar ABC transporter ATPase [Marivita cryptomonadis]|uniref:ABC transporter ATP-binding protein n=1 Tax=Marivita cryptomonadis TaxID=505252 RepID=UPI000A1DE797|nr:sn-glycerol-3-phosphate ABC transporter ATP-binding protein UgpC [Marivita cryptomonadis]OSQ55730.1 sugar ABC transporter ATPase [Marivita cryptomonadis]